MNKQTERNNGRKAPDKPRWDNWHVRLPNPKDQQRAIDLFHKSGAETKSDFVRGRILGEHFKVITVDKSAVTLQADRRYGAILFEADTLTGGCFYCINS